MNLFTIETGTFKLDGGAMFGVVPKVIWNKTNPADERNLIDMAMRCLLIQTDDGRLILVDTGIGHKYDAKFADLYAINHSVTLENSLNKLGFGLSDLTDVILTHLHFDHCGGTTLWNADKNRHETAFPNAKIYVQKSHLEWALNPNAREKASFFKENIQPLTDSGQLILLDGETQFTPEITLRIVNGHTEAQQLPEIKHKNHTLLYAADLFPTYGHLPLPYVMGYDTRPLLTLEEREGFLNRIASENIVLFYEHDPYNECGIVIKDEKGKFKSGETFPLTNLG